MTVCECGTPLPRITSLWYVPDGENPPKPKVHRCQRGREYLWQPDEDTALRADEAK